MIKPDTLYYSEKNDALYFRSDNPNISKIHTVYKMTSTGGNVWAFNTGYPDGLFALKDFKKILPNGEASGSALEHVNRLKSVSDQIKNLSVLNSIDYNFKYAPMEHQKTAIEYMFHYPKLALLVAMGLGKTVISVFHIELMKHKLGRPYKALVLAPKIVLRNWYEETLKFTNLVPIIYRGTISQRKKLRERILSEDWDLLITNYESVVVRGDSEDYKLFKMHCDFDVAILDEGSRLRGYRAQRTKAVEKVTQDIKRLYMLSGALSLGKPDDLFQPFKILNKHILGTNYFKFRNKYCVMSKYNRHVVTGYKNLDLLKLRVDPYCLVQERDNCIDLPPRIFSRRYYSLSPEQKELYNSIVREPVVYVGPEKEAINVELPVIKLTKLSQLLSGFLILPYPRNDEKCNNCDSILECIRADIYPWQKVCKLYDPENRVPKPATRYFELKKNEKLSSLIEIIKDSGSERIIIWARYRKEIEHIENVLASQKIRYITPRTEDSDIVFRENKGIKVYLGQVSQGIGTTLNDAHLMIFYSNSLDLEHRLQALDRNYRIGQESKVIVNDMVAHGTIDVHILRLLEAKTDIKNYFQSNIECSSCEKWMFCMERDVIPYSDECILSDVRKEIEEKKMIRIKTLRG